MQEAREVSRSSKQKQHAEVARRQQKHHPEYTSTRRKQKQQAVINFGGRVFTLLNCRRFWLWSFVFC